MGQWVRERLQGVQDRFPGATELVAALWGRVREEPLVGILSSVALHVVLIALLLYVGGPGKTYSVKRGDSLFVELPEIKDQVPPRGNPAARTPGPPAAPALPPPRPPVAQAEPKPPAAQGSPRAARPAETKPKAPESPRVASAPARQAEPVPERPVPTTS